MANKDVTQIRINNRTIGIVGLKHAIETMPSDYGQRSDDEIQVELLKRLSKDNYIPDRMAELYGRVFVREFRKYLGQPYYEETERQMFEIKILGTGCSRCDWLMQAVIDALAEKNLPADVEHITDMKEIVKYRVMGAPALMINGEIMCVGTVPSKEEIKKWIEEQKHKNSQSRLKP